MSQYSIQTVKLINFLLPVGLFIALAFVYLTGSNKALFYSINQYSHEQDMLWSHITFFGDTLLAYLLLTLAVLHKPRMIATAIVTLLIGFVVIHGLKRGFDLRRPAGVIDPIDFNIIGKTVKRHAFPSGHSATAFAVASVFTQHFRHKPIIWITAIILASLAAISRVMVGAHWPMDILAGSALGWLCGIAAFELLKNKAWPDSKKFQISLGILSLIAAIALFGHTGGYPLVETFSKVSAIIFAGIWIYFIYTRFRQK